MFFFFFYRFGILRNPRGTTEAEEKLLVSMIWGEAQRTHVQSLVDVVNHYLIIVVTSSWLFGC
jgi:hypothetical protein